jgi:hypothetical protein
MSNNHNHKTEASCAFAETLVTVLYGEATEAESTKFEQHLTDCRSCSEEFFTFGAVRNVVGEWRENAFLPLETPEIVLPPAKHPVAAQQTEKVSLLESLRDFLFPAGGFLQGAAAFAAIAVCAVLIAVFAFSFAYKNDNNIAGVKPATVESPLPKPDETLRVPAENELAINDGSQDKKQKPPVSTGSSESIAPRTKSAVRPAVAETEQRTKPAPKQKTQPRRPKKEELDFPADDFEDDSIRLADLFDEISSTD